MADENVTSTEQAINSGGIPEITFEMRATNTITQPTDVYLRSEGQPADAAAVGAAIDSINEDITNLGADISGLEARVEQTETTLSQNVLMKADMDDTLTKDGQPADAAAVGEAISDAKEKASTDLTQAITTLTQSVTDQITTGFNNITNGMFPVGSIYMTINTDVPAALPGTWVEILMPLTWRDVNAGTRSYITADQTTVPTRTVHYFLRTE